MSAAVHRAGCEHRARRPEQKIVCGVLRVRGYRVRERVAHGRRGGKAIRHEQDSTRSDQ
jgi:hypothetical protein